MLPYLYFQPLHFFAECRMLIYLQAYLPKSGQTKHSKTNKRKNINGIDSRMSLREEGKKLKVLMHIENFSSQFGNKTFIIDRRVDYPWDSFIMITVMPFGRYVVK
jgi:hypothetical protein